MHVHEHVAAKITMSGLSSGEREGPEGCRAQITHVIFDCDGLLLDTERLYTEVTQSILDRYGKNFEWSIKTNAMGRPPLEAAKVVIDMLELPLTPEEFHTELYSKLNSMFPEANLMPGAVALVRHLHSHGVPIAVATSSSSRSYGLKISKKMDLFSLFAHFVCSDDKEMKHGKPAPDIYLIAASRFNCPPKSNSNVLVFEDAPNGVLAGKAANMNVVMVPDKRTDPEKCRPADRVVGSLEDVDLTEWGLPPLP